MRNPLYNIDNAELKRQKLWLCQHLGQDEAEGLLELLDNITDYLIDVCGVPADEVCNFEDE